MRNISLVALAVTLFGGSVFAQTTFTVRIENVSTAMTLITSTPDSRAVPMSPGVWAVHTGADALFSAGAADRGDGLESIAEDGNPTTLAGALAGQQGVLSSNLFNTPVGASGPAPIGPGGAYEFTFNAPPGARLSFATMFIPSNDLFLAPEGDGIALFNPDGSSFSGEVTDQIMLWDAGTEENQEPGVGNNQAQRQPAANTGPADPNNLVRLVNDGFTYPAVSQVIRVTVNPFTTSVQEESEGVPGTFQLAQNYPNPFNPETAIRYTLRQAGRVRLSVYNLLGQRVANLIDEIQTQGSHQIFWNGRDNRGAQVSSGTYIYRMEMSGATVSRTMTLLR